MKRYNFKDGIYYKADGGEWIRYEDHVEAMKRIAGAYPAQPFAVVIDRTYEGEGPTLAVWNGENFSFSDGDCFEREADGSLDGYEAEWLTHYQLEKRLFPCASPAALTDEAAMRTALRIMANLEDRSGVMDGIDDDIKQEIVDEIAVTIRTASPADQAEKPDAFAVFRTGFKTTRVCGPDSLYEISVKYRNIDDLHAADDELRAAMSTSKEGA